MTLTHGFRTPLNSSLMLLESILQKIVDEAVRRTVMILIAQINLLLCLVNDMLDLRMIADGVFKFRNKKFNPLQSIQHVFSILGQHAEIQNSKLTMEVFSSLGHADVRARVLSQKSTEPVVLPQHLYGDEIRLKQVLINLIKNALHCSYNKPVQIKVCFN